MRTQIMHERALGLPWLEHFPTDGGQPQQTVLDDTPFVIGRSEDCDLSIDSNRISRRHVEVLKDDHGYRLRDLGSTNGTLLNGKPIEEARLCDGDLFVVADLELTFFTGRAADPRDMATQAFDCLHGRDPGSRAGWDLVREARRLDEVLAHRAIAIHYQPILELQGGNIFAYQLCESQHPSTAVADIEQTMLKTDCRLSSRYRRLRRILAVEQALRLPQRTTVFLKLDEVEIGDETLGKSLEELAQRLPAAHPLAVVVPQRTVSDAAYFRDLFARLRDAGIRLAYDGVAASSPALVNQTQLCPDYLIVDESLTQDIYHSPTRQRQLQVVIQAAADSGCEVIAMEIERKEDAEFCCQAGCRYGKGKLYANAEPTPAGCLTN